MAVGFVSIYEQFKAMGLCVRCASPVENSTGVLCPRCRDKRIDYDRMRRNKERKKPEGKKRNKYMIDGLSIKQVNELAIKNGVSYGQMVAILDGCTALRTVFH